MKHPFEVGKVYRNRIGKYRVTNIGETEMTIQYADGQTTTSSIDGLARIWENIQENAEIRADRARTPVAAPKKTTRKAKTPKQDA